MRNSSVYSKVKFQLHTFKIKHIQKLVHIDVKRINRIGFLVGTLLLGVITGHFDCVTSTVLAQGIDPDHVSFVTLTLRVVILGSDFGPFIFTTLTFRIN